MEKCFVNSESLNNHPYFKDMSPKEFKKQMALILEAFARDILEIDEIELLHPPLEEKHFRAGYIKNWINRYFGINPSS